MKLNIVIYKEGEEYTPTAGDVITFAMKKSYESTVPVISKTIPNDPVALILEGSDTANLPFGIYVYDIKLSSAEGDIDTFIKGHFYITEATH